MCIDNNLVINVLHFAIEKLLDLKKNKLNLMMKDLFELRNVSYVHVIYN